MTTGADQARLQDAAARVARDPQWSPWPEPSVMAQVDSTMTWLRERSVAQIPEGTAVLADKQTAGRGRHGRAWSSPPGSGVWASVLVDPEDAPIDAIGVLPLLWGVEIAEALADGFDVPLVVKWPNDVVVVDDAVVDPAGGNIGLRKVGGLLAERLPDGRVILGIGVNVTTQQSALPPGAVSLHALGADASQEDAAVVVLLAIARAFQRWREGDRDLARYRRSCVTLGRQVSITDLSGGSALNGVAIDLDESGRLLVQVDDRIVTVSAGDVTLASG